MTAQTTLKEDSEFDPLFKVRPLLELFRQHCSSKYEPGSAISIDEAMITFNGWLFFKQYMKSKPRPWGIKVWCRADPSTGYLLDFSVYTGKAQQPMKGVYILTYICIILIFPLILKFYVQTAMYCVHVFKCVSVWVCVCVNPFQCYDENILFQCYN